MGSGVRERTETPAGTSPREAERPRESRERRRVGPVAGLVALWLSAERPRESREHGSRGRRWVRPVAGLVALWLSAACSLQTLGAPTGELTLTATFDDVQSLVAGHSVQVSDVRVGSVTDIRLEGYRAKVTMSIEDGNRVPEGTSAIVAKTSILGENYIELDLPDGGDMTTGPFMRSGSAIAVTSVKPDIEQVTERAGPLIDALGAQDVNAILDAAATGIGGKGKDLNRLLRQTTEVTTAYAKSRQDLARTIDGLARLGDELAKGTAELDRLPGTLADATARLNHGRRHIKKTLRELTALAREVNDTIYPRHEARLRTLLRELDAVSTSAVRGKEDLKVLVSRVQSFIDQPPLVVNGQLLIFVWLKGLLLPEPKKSDRPRLPNSVDDFRLLLGPPR